MPARELRKQLPADQVTAQDEEKIDPDPTETMGFARQRKSHDAGVINNDDDNGQRPEKIETGLAFTIGETRIDSELEWRSYFGSWLVNGEGKNKKQELESRKLEH